jgi:hypothetical protein
MTKSRVAKDRHRILYGPTIQYPDAMPGQPLDIEPILSAFEQADTDVRRAFLCGFAHDLTVAVRVLLLDRPVPESDLDRVWEINEFMHQLTSCANPRGIWSASDSAKLLRAIIDTAFQWNLDRYVGHALGVAAADMSHHNQLAAK